MKLRNKIITTVGFVLIFSLIILLLMSVAGSMIGEYRRVSELEKLVAETTPLIYSTCGIEKFETVINKWGFIAQWHIQKKSSIIVGNSRGPDDIIGKLFSKVVLARENGENISFHFIVRKNRILHGSHANFLLTGLFLTVFLAILLYTLLSYLVIRPIEVVSDACKEAAKGIKPGKNGVVAGRNDEAGVMVKEFYSLLDEVFDYRQRLEEKVKEASLEIQKTHEKLIVSQRLSATGKLAAGIAHEINNPLGGMMNAVIKLKKNAADSKDREYFYLLEECLAKIESLVKELLSFVRTSGEFTEVYLHECVDFAEKMIAHTLKEKGITFENKVADNAVIKGDGGQIQQLLLNLLMNSMDSISRSDGKISVNTAGGADPGKWTLSITDNGCGIPQKDLSSVFDLFYTTKEAGQGTGLGLSIVHSIVKHHKGTVDIESREGEMTRVSITFPSSSAE